jgi:hypothetical protein
VGTLSRARCIQSTQPDRMSLKSIFMSRSSRGLFLQVLLQKLLCTFFMSCICYVPHLPHPWFDDINYWFSLWVGIMKVIHMHVSSACFMLLDNGQEDQTLWTYWSQLFYEFHSALLMLQVSFWFVTVLRYLNFIIFSKNVLASLSLKDAADSLEMLIYASTRLASYPSDSK